MMSAAHRLSRSDTVAVLVDVQVRLIEAMWNAAATVRRAAVLMQGCRALGVPILWTEQMPAKLGPTVPELSAALAGATAISKSAFSCPSEPAFASALSALGRRTVLLAGIETHVCVYQTALDLVALGMDVRIATDAVASRSPDDRAAALQAMAAAGASIVTVEMALFDLLGTADDPAFRTILRLVK
jgi:nicotinamidase-related amidase